MKITRRTVGSGFVMSANHQTATTPASQLASVKARVWAHKLNRHVTSQVADNPGNMAR